jgi:hypothetical protein
LVLGKLEPVLRTAVDKLQQELGDLEVTWGNLKKQQLLLGLPLAALLQLLWDPRTRVASEDTAVYTAARWLEDNPGGAGGEAAKRLLGLLRLLHCTPTFLSTGDDGDCIRGLLRAADVSDRTIMQLCAMRGVTDTQFLTWMSSAGFTGAGSLLSQPRPVSATEELVVTWRLQLRQIKAAFLEAQQSVAEGGEPDVYLWGSGVVWQGRVWQLILGVGVSGAFGLYLDCKPSAACCKVQLWYRNTTDVRCGGTQARCVGPHMAWNGLGTVLLDCGPNKPWAEVRPWLVGQEVVHSGDLVHLGATVTQVA